MIDRKNAKSSKKGAFENRELSRLGAGNHEKTCPLTPGSRRTAELIERAQAGEREAFAMLYRRHQARVYRFARAMTGSDTMAEDIVQEVFLGLMRGLGRYDASRAALATYLFGVARNIARHQTRGRRRLTRLDAASDAVAVDDPSADIAQSDRVRHVRAGIAALPRRYREVDSPV